MLVERINKETTDVSRIVADMTWWLDADETLTDILSTEVIQGMSGWSEAPFPPPDSPPPFDPTPLLLIGTAIDASSRQVIAFVEFGTAGVAYTIRVILRGTSQREVTIELGVQVTGVPPEEPMPLPPPPSEAAGQGPTAAYLNIKGGTMQGPLYLFEKPFYPTEAATKQYVDSMDWVGGPYLPLAGGVVDGPVTFNNTVTLQLQDPIGPLEATTKQYVDGRIQAIMGGPFLPLAGGVLTGPLTVNGNFFVNATLNNPAATSVGGQTVTAVTINANNSQVLWGHSSRMTLQTSGGGVSYTSNQSSAYYGQATANDTIAGGTAAWVVGMQGASGNVGVGTVTNAADFMGHSTINSAGGAVTNHYIIYGPASPAGRAVNEYGFYMPAPSGIGTTAPVGWLEVRTPDSLSTTRVTRFRNAAGSILDIMGDSKIGWFGVAPAARQTVTGAWAGNAAGKALCVALAAYGFIIDSTTA